jgi:transaldolase
MQADQMVGCLADLKVKIFADGADIADIVRMAQHPLVKGFTTNPSLMRKAGVGDYEAFARSVLAAVSDRPVSFEVFADDFDGMIRQARTVASWGSNVNVKIPVTYLDGHFTGEIIERLSSYDGIAINVTAIMTLGQVKKVANALDQETPAIVSVFAGRIADTGVDPVPFMRECKRVMEDHPKAQLLWASTREVLNIFQADQCGCDIITVTNEILGKLHLAGKSLAEFSLETVREFHRDATRAAYSI